MEALRSNGASLPAERTNPVVLSDDARAGCGATGKRLSRRATALQPNSEVAAGERSCGSKWVTAMSQPAASRKSPTGVRTKASRMTKQLGWESRQVRSTVAGVGSSCAREGRGSGSDVPGDRVRKSAAANSSTMKGLKGLAGQCMRRRCQTVRRVSLVGNGGLLASTSRNRALKSVRGNYGAPGGRT